MKPLVVLLLALLLLASGAVPAGAANCGGAIACQCGDKVTADYTMTANLGPCPGHGLLLASGVTLDCATFTVSATWNSTKADQYGLYLQGAAGQEIVGAVLKNCRVTGYRVGVRFKRSNGSRLEGSTIELNGDAVTHVGYGVQITDASTQNTVKTSTIRSNGDEGIHVSTGSDNTVLDQNTVLDNYRENIYILGAVGVQITNNTAGASVAGGVGTNSLYMKDANSWNVSGNTFQHKNATVTGDSHDNQFTNNTFTRTLRVEYYDDVVDRYPRNNTVRGGSISFAGDCLKIDSAYDNVFIDVVFGASCDKQVVSLSTSRRAENTLIGSEPSKLSLDANSILHYGWRLNVHVQDSVSAPLAGARIIAKDGAGTTIFDLVTDASGNLPEQNVTTRFTQKPIAKTPHSFETILAGYISNAQAVYLTAHLTLTIVMQRQ